MEGGDIAVLHHGTTHGETEIFKIEGLGQHIGKANGLTEILHVLLKIAAAGDDGQARIATA